MKPIRVGVLTTHPIQYQVPWFRELAKEPGIDLTVFFGMIPDAAQQGDGFGVPFEWDVPLLEGYSYRVLMNVARKPSVTTFLGCDTPEISSVVRDEGFDAFIVNGWVAKSCLQVLIACNRYGVPCIVRGESNNLRPRAGWKRFIHRKLLKRYSAVLYIGKANRLFYLENGVPEGKLFFAPYCVENDRLSLGAAEQRSRREELRSRWGIPLDAVAFLFCGKFVAKKRPMDCLEGLRLALATRHGTDGSVRHSPRPIHLLMVGSGELLDDCQSVALRDDLPVSFAGFLNQNEIASAYAAADCLLLPSDDGETWGLVVNEAMACGLSAIVSDRVGCHPDLAIPGHTGHVFPLGDTSGLGALMASVAHDSAWLREAGDAARRHVSGYSYDMVVRGTMDALEAVLSGAREAGVRG